MRYFRNLPIGRKLTVITLLISGVALLLAGTVLAIYEQVSLRNQMGRDFAILTDIFDDNVASGLAFNDPASIEQTLGTLGAHRRIVAAGVYDPQGKLVARYRRAGAPVGFQFPRDQLFGQREVGDRLDTFKDVILAGERIGVVYIGADFSELRESVWFYSGIVGGMLVVCLLFTLLLSTRLQRVISGPIVDLAHTVAKVSAEKDYTVRAVKQSDDELGRLIDGFNGMLAQIQTRDAALQWANDTLEARVRERTDELQQEIAERRRSEAALQASHQRFEIVMRATSDVIWDRDMLANTVWRNENFQTVFGYRPGEIGFTPEAWSSCVHPDDLPGALASLQHTLESGEQFWSSEYRFRRHDGSYASLLDRGHVIRDEQGRPTRMIGAMQDITALKQAQEETARQQARFKFIFDAVPVGFTWMESGNISSRIANPAHAVITGVPVARCQQVELYRLATHPDDRAVQDALHAQIVAGKIDHYDVEKRYVHPDGSVRWTALTVRFYRDSGSGQTQEISSVVDITERKRAESKLAEASGLLQAMLENSPDFIYFKDRESRFVRVSRSKVRETLLRLPALRARLNGHGHASPLPEDDLLNGLTDFDTYQDVDAKLAYADEQEIIRTGKPLVDKLESQTFQDGALRWSLTNKMPWLDRNGKVIGTIGVSKDVTQLKETEAKLAQMHRQLLEVSRQAGMAEVATGVLHNVGNVLNSVNVSATLVIDQVRESKAGNLPKIAAMLQEHPADLANFLTNDPKGRRIPAYLVTITAEIEAERKTVVDELEHLRRNIAHIKDIVGMQQSYAKVSGVTETVAVDELVEDSLRMNASAMVRHGLKVAREFEPGLFMIVDRHKVLQILVNLIRNAKYACDDSGRTDKELTVRVAQADGHVRIAVGDNGVGIAPENLTRIFAHGFTTRKEGHGFGLHSGALAAKELGGSLTVQSDGLGRGATFILELPFKPGGGLS